MADNTKQLETENAKLKAEIAEHIKARLGAEDLARKANATAERSNETADRALDELDSVKAHAQTEIERLKAKGSAVKPGPTELAPEHRGVRKYVATEALLRKGEYILPGTRITLTNERPSKALRLIDDSYQEPTDSGVPVARDNNVLHAQGKRDSDTEV